MSWIELSFCPRSHRALQLYFVVIWTQLISIQSEKQEQERYFNPWHNTSDCTQKAVKKVILRADGADCPPQIKNSDIFKIRQRKNNNYYKGDQFLYCVRVFQAIRKHASFETANGIFSYSLYLSLSNSLFLYAPFDLRP